jgi:malate/lactate dehydrogenase
MHAIQVFGIGNVGSAVVNNLILKSIGGVIYITDIDYKRLSCEYLEFKSMLRIMDSHQQVEMSGDVMHARIYVICAGVNSKGFESRDEMLSMNKSIVESILHKIAEVNSRAIVLMVTNPSGELSKLAHDYVSHVIAIGNRLDNARYKDSHLYGKHENPVDYYKSIIDGKGYTSWGVASEVIQAISELEE